MSFTEKNYLRNQNAYTQGDPSNMVYIVKEGEFELIRVRKKPTEDHMLLDDKSTRGLIGPTNLAAKNNAILLQRTKALKGPIIKNQTLRLT